MHELNCDGLKVILYFEYPSRLTPLAVSEERISVKPQARYVKFDAFDVDHEQRLCPSHQNVPAKLEVTAWLSAVEKHGSMVLANERVSELFGHADVVGIPKSEVFKLKQLFATISAMNVRF